MLERCVQLCEASKNHLRNGRIPLATRRIVKGLFGVGLVLAMLFGAFLWLTTPAAADIHIERSTQRLIRGRIIYNLAHCDVCHSTRDFDKFDGPVMPGHTGAGLVFPSRLVPHGRISAPNITPDPVTGIGAWTDGEKVRAVRNGFARGGRKLIPVMPYEVFAHLSDDDVYSLVAFLDALPAVRNEVPDSLFDRDMQWRFRRAMFMSRLGPTINSVPEPDHNSQVAYGEYLVQIGQCAGCHGADFSGGNSFHESATTTVISSNLTPDMATGIGRWSEGDFLSRFTAYRRYLVDGAPTVPDEAQTPMPWLNFCQLDERELKAIFAFLRTSPPVSRQVQAFGTHPVGANRPQQP
jgi:mono/diheme cytochrome c family protein